ncbi:DUF3368 domain-containing protein [Laspinema palackyanum]|uniref:DUF3368 domain-containing protein n=1 Tax=Laspinema palackyanum TaxID=3231601 RepID=UPI00349F3257
MIVVSNSSPLIALAKIGEFELLHSLYEELWIPEAVREEVARVGQDSAEIEKNRPGIEEVRGATWIRRVNVSNLAAVQILRGRLDAGESEAIVLALELNADLLLIDEARGRRVAEAEGITTSGTVGTLVAAKTKGLIWEVTPLLKALVASGFRMSQDLYEMARQIAGEEG